MISNPNVAEIPQINVTPSGFEYYDKLPVGFRLATIDDFITDGKRKIGMMFLIQWLDDADVYQICFVSMNLDSKILSPFVEYDRVFVKD